MSRVSVIIPNLNGMSYLPSCLESLLKQTEKDFEIILIDNGSTDGSAGYVRRQFPQVRLRAFDGNTGFCHAVNAGIRMSRSPFVILLNNDTVCDPRFVEALLAGMQAHPGCFSCGAKMVRMDSPDITDDAGDFYSAFGWAFARGKGRPSSDYERPCRIFSACAGAAIYRKSLLEKTGLFDEHHFAYLEDLDLGWRAMALGLENWFWPDAVVLHAGSASSGSRHNAFKVSHTARNNLFVIRKNMTDWQLFLNAPLLAAGVLIKGLFFLTKGLGRPYAAGVAAGLFEAGKCRRIPSEERSFIRDLRLQMQLWGNCIRHAAEGLSGRRQRKR